MDKSSPFDKRIKYPTGKKFADMSRTPEESR
jgi:hypothetical protein